MSPSSSSLPIQASVQTSSRKRKVLQHSPDLKRHDNNKKSKTTSLDEEHKYKYMCSLVVITSTPIKQDYVDCCIDYKAIDEQDAVREAIAALLRSNVIQYKEYKATFNEYNSSIITYKEKCRTQNINNDIELWKSISRPSLCSKRVMAHVLMLDENGSIDTQICNKKTFLQRMYAINNFKVLSEIIEEHSVPWIMRISFSKLCLT